MINVDEFQQWWAEQGSGLGTRVVLSRELLSMVSTNRAHAALQRLGWGQALVTAINFLAILAIGSFLGNHIHQLRFVLPAAALHIGMIAVLIAEIQQIRLALLMDFGKPVLAIQKQIETLRRLRIRTTQWILLLTPLAWTPLLIVALRELWGVDAYRVPGTAFLLSNLAFGVAFIPLVIWLSQRFGNRISHMRVTQALLQSIAGYNLRAATAHLAVLSEFEREESKN